MSRIISIFSAFIGMCSSGTRKTHIVEALYQLDNEVIADLNNTGIKVMVWPN